jgi:hypothetical protein
MVGFPPSESGSIIDDEIASTDQAAMEGSQYGQDEEGFMDGCPCSMSVLALLRDAGNANPSIPILKQPTRQGSGEPSSQPVMHILIGELPQGPQEHNQCQGRSAPPLPADKGSGQRRWDRRKANRNGRANVAWSRG